MAKRIRLDNEACSNVDNFDSDDDMSNLEWRFNLLKSGMDKLGISRAAFDKELAEKIEEAERRVEQRILHTMYLLENKSK